MVKILNKFNQTYYSRKCAIEFNSLINVVSSKMMEYCKDQMVDNSFKPLLKYMKFGQEHNSIEEYQNKVQNKLELENLPTSFNQYTAFHEM
jgi:hypothetical protein